MIGVLQDLQALSMARLPCGLDFSSLTITHSNRHGNTQTDRRPVFHGFFPALLSSQAALFNPATVAATV